MKLGKPNGTTKLVLGDDEHLVGEFVLELVDGNEEFDEAGNRYLHPVPAEMVRFGYEARGTFVTLFEGPMRLVEALVIDAELVG